MFIRGSSLFSCFRVWIGFRIRNTTIQTYPTFCFIILITTINMNPSSRDESSTAVAASRTDVSPKRATTTTTTPRRSQPPRRSRGKNTKQPQPPQQGTVQALTDQETSPPQDDDDIGGRPRRAPDGVGASGGVVVARRRRRDDDGSRCNVVHATLRGIGRSRCVSARSPHASESDGTRRPDPSRPPTIPPRSRRSGGNGIPRQRP